MEVPKRVSFRDSQLASRKAEEAANRRSQAAMWIEAMAGPLGLSSNPSEKEFISCLRSGITLCNTINKIKPGAVPKVVINQSFGLALEIQPLPAYQYFENIRNFLVAVDELKLPSFEASDLERDTLEAGSAAKIVDCILALKSYHEWKHSNGGCGSWKHAKSPLVPLTASRIQLNGPSLGSSVRRLDLPDNMEKPQSMLNADQTSGDKVNDLVQALSNCMLDSKENIDQSLLDSWRQGSVDSTTVLGKIISSCMQEQQCCNLHLLKKSCNHWNLLESQEHELVELKALLSRTKVDFITLQSQLQNDLTQLGAQIQGLCAAAAGYHGAMKENRDLYNMLQELRGNIRVFCRIRPSFPLDVKSSIDYIGNDGSLMIFDPLKPQNTRKIFQFNKVFGPAASQEEVYKDTQSLVRSVMDGYNVCIFAYGQTGSGKTHTMCGPSDGPDKDMGINFMALNDLFELSFTRSDIRYEIQVQMVEIYNEQVRDLLCEEASVTKLEIRNCSGNGRLSLPDATMHQVQSTTDVLDLMKLGDRNRAFSSTAMNNRSSRSHSVLTVHVHGKDTSGSTLTSCLNLIDLAGSERVDKSEVTGDRLKEAQYINKSLACLGDVISALANKNSHIPYRNSKLTQLLQNSLGGHAKMLMFAHVSPEADSYGETVSTLKFAQRVSTIELGAAHVNKESSEIRQLKEEIDNLKKALASREEEAIILSNRVERPKYTTEITPPRPRRLSIENSSIRKSAAAAANPDNKKKALANREEEAIIMSNRVERPKYTTEITPPRLRRLSIENSSTRRSAAVVGNPDNKKMSKSPLPRPSFAIENGPPRSRRLSLDGPKTLASNQQQAPDIPRSLEEKIFSPQLCQADVLDLNVTSSLSPISYSPAGRSQLQNLERRYNRMPMPDSYRNLEELVMTPDTSNKYKTRSSNANGSNVKGSQIRKSIQNMGKLINSSEKRTNQQQLEVTSSAKFGRTNDVVIIKSPVTADARVRRRQSLTNVGSGISRRSSLGGHSTDGSDTQIARTRTPPPVHPSSSKATKRRV